LRCFWSGRKSRQQRAGLGQAGGLLQQRPHGRAKVNKAAPVARNLFARLVALVVAGVRCGPLLCAPAGLATSVAAVRPAFRMRQHSPRGRLHLVGWPALASAQVVKQDMGRAVTRYS
jgi:hypothetical protein